MEVSQILDDAAASVAWVMENIEKYGGSKAKIYLAGHSAGGYIVAMLGLDKQYLAKYDIDPDKEITAVVPYSGQSITHFAHRKKMGIAQEKPIIDEMAPLFHVRGDADVGLADLGALLEAQDVAHAVNFYVFFAAQLLGFFQE